MSATSSEAAARQRFAALAAHTLKRALAKPQWAGRRLLLRGLHGLLPADLLPALLESGAATAAVYPEGLGGAAQNIAASRLSNGSLLIPYLVDSSVSASAGSNIGGDGFAAALRTHFLAGAAEGRVLLILDRQPPETVLSTTEDAALLPELAWPALAREAAVAESPSLPVLVQSVVDDYLARCVQDASLTWREAQRLWAWVEANKNQPDLKVGLDLPRLGFYIADNRPSNRRLVKCADWRRDLDDWIASPSQDLARKLASKRISVAGAAKVLESYSLRGLDYTGFTLEDLAPGSDGAPLDLDSVRPVSGALLALNGQHSLAMWLPAAGGELHFNLIRSLGPGETVRVRWQHDRYRPLGVSGRKAAANVAPPADRHWLFGTIELSSPGGAVRAFHLAVFFSDDSVAGFERALDIDPDAGGFVCADEPQIVVWGRSGKELGTAQLANPAADVSSSESPQQVTGLWQGLFVGPVPVLPRGADEPDLDEEDTERPVFSDEPSAGEDEGDDLDNADSPAGEALDPLLEQQARGRGEAMPPAGEQPTLAHAMLAFRQAAWPENSSIPEYPGASQEAGVSASYGAQRLVVRPRLGKTGLLGPEQLILQHPQGATYRVHGQHVDVLQPLPQPEPAWTQEMKAFADARRVFFELAASAGSVFAVDPRCPQASAYTSAYRALLEALPRAGTSRTEYEQLLLIDTTEIAGIPDLLVAPTSPLSVAYYASLAVRFAALVEEGADELGKADIGAFSPQYLLPLLKAESGWHEAAPCHTAFLWRRYRPLDGSTPGALERNSAFIAGRIAFFLNVHPGMNNPDATVTVTFADPGAEPALDALREFYRKDLTSQTYTRPKLRVVLDGGAEGTRHAVGALAASAGSDPLDRLVCTRSVIRHRPMEDQDFSHLTFLFRSPGERKVRPVGLQRRAGTTYAGALACSPGRVVIPDADPVFATGVFTPEPGTESSDLEAIQYRCLELVGGQGGENLAPGQTRMVTVRTSDKALSEWYTKSAWVVHLDRLVGLEAFTAAGQSRRTVLEYEEGADPDSYGYDGITGTEYVGPYVAALNKALDGIAVTDPDQSRSLMALLESVSGRWALQIVQRPQNKVLERAGTACAIRYAQTVDHALDPAAGLRAVVSLEELIPSFPQAGIPRRLAGTRMKRDAMCDDLLLVSVLPRGSHPPLVQLSVTEIKFWSEAPDYSAAAAQVEESIQWLAGRFQDPGPLKDLRGRELAELIRSAASRNAAFGLAHSAREDAEELLQRVAEGDYELGFGHWRNGSYRRGMVVSVERNASGSLSLAQLNGAAGPVDVVSVRNEAVRSAFHGDPIPTPAVWHRLDPVPPAQPPAQDSAAVGSPDPAPPMSPIPQEHLTAESDNPPNLAAPTAETQLEREEVASVARGLDSAFAKYGLAVEPFDVTLAHLGPSVIRFRTRTLGKLSINEIERRARDISREVAAIGEVAVGHEPGYVTIDVPRQSRRPVPLAGVIGELDGPARAGALSFIPGIAPSGAVHIADLSRLPHLLVAGATGSGKSVFLRGLLVELLRARTPEQLELVIVDPKRLDFAPFAKAPHVRNAQIISDPDIALETLRSTLESELERRQPILEAAGVSSASEFYESGGTLEELPQLVILVDEFADLVLSGSDRKSFSELIQRYAQLTRAYGIFLVLATQRPSVDVITGSIKANLSARIAFSLPSVRDSMTVLDQGGAENLLGDGDLLFYRNGKVERLQAPLTNLADVRAVLG
ncbi:FtsK/SpoIIIE domain-containing protein [Streptomyces sp. NPDC002917]|uniref:FtsK/SpoIIIE domain-containing protein n=1 Tax=Streptomyces sp. NPDC002917 TaxID=3364671 RepID=UPI0036C929D7